MFLQEKRHTLHNLRCHRSQIVLIALPGGHLATVAPQLQPRGADSAVHDSVFFLIPAEQINFDTFGQTVLHYDVTLLPRLGHCYFCVVTFSSLLYFCSLNVEESCISHSSTFPSSPANERLHARVHCLLPCSSGLSGKYLPLEVTQTRGMG